MIPGGSEEALIGHENAYKLFWGKRQGFAYVAKQTKALVYMFSDLIPSTHCTIQIIPFTVRNGEEMKWNPYFFVINLLRLYKIYYWILEKNIPVVSWLTKQVVQFGWYFLSWVAVPIPVKATVVAGDPVDYDPDTVHFILLSFLLSPHSLSCVLSRTL